MNRAIIIEGFWNVGKTSLAKRIIEKHPAYNFVPEIDHQDSGVANSDAGNWYTEQHTKREELFLAHAVEHKPSVIERSIISTAAYAYAAEEDFPASFHALRRFAQKVDEVRPLLVFLYQKPEDILKTEYSLRNKNIKSKLTNQKFVERYEYFFCTVLPFQYDIVPLFINQTNHGNQDASDYALGIIESALIHERLAQVNVVCAKMVENIPEFLILKRNSKKGDFWQTITGGVKPDDGLRSTVQKELAEELGITVDPGRILSTNYSYYFSGSEGYELNEYVFGYQIDGSDDIELSVEHTESAFLSLGDAANKIKFDTNKKALTEVLASLKK